MSSLMKYENKAFRIVGTRPVRPDGADKVSGRARYAADFNLPGQLVGKVLRSPHAHARIRSIDVTAAAALPGVKAIVTRDDFPEMPVEYASAGETTINFRDLTRNVMAREKALYEGHPVAALAATSESTARRALRLIKVEYEVLPHVIDVVEAMKPGAPLLHETQYTEGVQPRPDKPSNVAKRFEFELGDIDAGFRQADLILERETNTQPVHQGYLEPQACLASCTEDGCVDLWTGTQGIYIFRAQCAKLLQMDVSKIRVIPAELGGAFGGKNTVVNEPLAIALSRKAHRPVKMVLGRDEVFRASGASGGNVKVRIGCTRDGRITAAEAQISFQAGAFAGSPVDRACVSTFTRYDIPNVRVVGNDVTVNRQKTSAYRAPGAPIAVFAVETAIDDVAAKLGIDPVEFRLRNAGGEGTQTYFGPRLGPNGFAETLRKAKEHPHYGAPLGPDQGRGVATGFWSGIGMETSGSVTVNEDGTVTLLLGIIDVGGSRASMAMMVAEELGIAYEQVRPIVADTGSLGFNFITAGSRGTFAGGIASILAARDAIEKMRRRVAQLREVPLEAVAWKDGRAAPASADAAQFEPMSLADIAKIAGKTGGPIAGHAEINAQGAAPGFGTHLVDVAVDRQTGLVKILRYTVVQDVGKAIHPAYVEGQLQGGAVQGIGWALNEEYVYGSDGVLQNPGFLDYRVPVASDVPFIETILVEVPNPNHPYGVRGCGEVSIIPPLAAISNAIRNAVGVRLCDQPMSPTRVLKAIDEAAAR